MKILCVSLLMAVSLLVFGTSVLGEEDLVKEKCKNDPWCYQQEVEKIGDPELCENILKYWPKAGGVHGWCFYRLALKQKDCSLCDRIKAKDIRENLCYKDVCNKNKKQQKQTGSTKSGKY